MDSLIEPGREPALIGKLVDGRYRVLAAMASGSMGAVYRAERIPVGKLVAMKFVHASFADDAEFLARFERETRVMSKLAHPNCVSVVDFGMFEGTPYLVMEYVDGVTLRSIIDDEAIAVPRAVGFARQLAAGLAHAHSHDIIHRDIKPANIMIGQAIGAGEVVRILDFGLARLRGPGSGRDPTAANVVVGTPNYMAPEQTIAGEPLDARTDIYAAGVVLFEMIVGDRPFSADDTPSVLAMHRTAPIPRLADRVGPDVMIPDGLQAIVDTAMAKRPADRYQTAMAMSAALEALGTVLQTGAQRALPSVREDDSRSDTGIAPTLIAPAATSSRSPRRSGTRVGLALAGVLLVGGAAVAYVAHDRAAAPPPAVVTVVGDARVATPDADEPAVAVAPMDAAAVEIAAADAPEAVEIEMDPDPMTAIDPNPVDPAADPANAAADEADDAPETKTAADERDAPQAASPALARTVHDAVLLLQAGDKELALTSLRALWGHQQNSAYIPFLIGNLYFDKRWWNVALDHYRIAVLKNGGYKGNQVLLRNLVRMLGSKKTASRAETFLRGTIGHPAKAALLRAAKSDPNAAVKKAAARIARVIR